MNDQPSPWHVGAGLGLSLSCGVLLALYWSGAAPSLAWMGIFAGLFVFGLGLPMAAWGLAGGAWTVIQAWRELTAEQVGGSNVLEAPVDASGSVSSDFDAEDEETPAQRKRQHQIAHWHVFTRRLWDAATAYGWDIRTLTGKNEPTRVTSQTGWNTGTNNLARAGFLVKDTTGTRPTVSDAEWKAGRLWEQCPCPAGEPPEISPPPYTPQRAPHPTAAKHAVIEN